MNTEKQIEEMAKMLYDYLGTMILTETDSKIISSYLYKIGYRKQNEGEWLEQVRVSKEGKPLIRHYKCNLCGVYLATQANFCPNCGAKMKGSE